MELRVKVQRRGWYLTRNAVLGLAGMLVLSACNSSSVVTIDTLIPLEDPINVPSEDEARTVGQERRIWLSLSDFSEGTRSLLTYRDGRVERMLVANADQDSVVAVWGDMRVLMARSTGEVSFFVGESIEVPAQTLDATSASGLTLNPSILVALSPQEALIFMRGANEIWLVERREDEVILAGKAFIEDLAAAEDPDGLVDLEAAVVLDDARVLVALGRYAFNFDTFSLDFFGSQLAAFDSEALRQAALAGIEAEPIALVDLEWENPVGGLASDQANGILWVGTGATYGELDGGIQALDLTTLAHLPERSCSEETLNVDLGQIAVLPDLILSPRLSEARDNLVFRSSGLAGDEPLYLLEGECTARALPELGNGIAGMVTTREPASLITWSSDQLRFRTSGLAFVLGAAALGLPVYSAAYATP